MPYLTFSWQYLVTPYSHSQRSPAFTAFGGLISGRRLRDEGVSQSR